MMRNFAFIFGIFLPAISHAAFTDVSTTHTNAAAVAYVESKGIVQGYDDGTYRPNQIINRAEFTKIIIGSKFSKYAIDSCNAKTYSFADFERTDWFAQHVCVAKKNNVIKGYADGTFGPSKSINFAEAMKIVSSAHGLSVPPSSRQWWEPYRDVLLNKNALPPSYISADQQVTRGDMAEMIYRLAVPPPVTTQLKAGNHVFTLKHDGTTRTYRLHVPASSVGQQSPLVLFFHGGGSSPEYAIENYDLNDTADREGFLIAYPEGTGKKITGTFRGTWNAGECCGGAVEEESDDVGFTTAIIDDIAAKAALDRKRVYATGISNGGMMSYRLACELSDSIAGIAPVAAPTILPRNCHPSRAVPTIHIHGREDPCALYEGGKCGGCLQEALGGSSNESIGMCEAMDIWVTDWKKIQNLSSKTETVIENNSSKCVTYGPNEPGEFVLCTVEQLGHRWPGAGTYGTACKGGATTFLCKKNIEIFGPFNDSLSANGMMWWFLSKHTLP